MLRGHGGNSIDLARQQGCAGDVRQSLNIYFELTNPYRRH
jgi:hypothetical protein